LTNERLRFVPATSVSLEEFAAAFTAGFSGYAVPLEVDAPKLSRRIRVDHYDLQHSLVAYDGDERVGMVALAIRGAAGWCGGLGVVPERRGRGVGRLLMGALLERARAAGLRTLTLEVLASNTPARRLYEGAGMRVVRDLFVLERGERLEAEPLARDGVALDEAGASELLPHFTRLHKVAPAWQRDLPSLLVGSTRGLRLGPRESPRAYALLLEGSDGKTYLPDLAAEDAGAARELSAGLAGVAGSLGIINEPEQSHFVAPLLEQGFVETARQHEMAMEL
jgi:ribosomal protein S18 acetylase RimI-like enzyme